MIQSFYWNGLYRGPINRKVPAKWEIYETGDRLSLSEDEYNECDAFQSYVEALPIYSIKQRVDKKTDPVSDNMVESLLDPDL